MQQPQREDHEVKAEDSAAQVIEARGQPGVWGDAADVTQGLQGAKKAPRLPNTRVSARMWPLQGQNWDTPHSSSPGVYSENFAP